MHDTELEREFEAFVLETRQSLVALGLVLTGDVGVAQDLAQETLVRAWQRWPKLRRYDQPASWARHVIHNLSVDHCRRREREARLARSRTVDEARPAVLEHEDLRVAIASLKPSPRRAVVLHYVVGLGVAEIAAEMGVAIGTVGSWLSRSRAEIADSLGRARPAKAEREER